MIISIRSYFLRVDAFWSGSWLLIYKLSWIVFNGRPSFVQDVMILIHKMMFPWLSYSDACCRLFILLQKLWFVFFYFVCLSYFFRHVVHVCDSQKQCGRCRMCDKNQVLRSTRTHTSVWSMQKLVTSTPDHYKAELPCVIFVGIDFCWMSCPPNIFSHLPRHHGSENW